MPAVPLGLHRVMQWVTWTLGLGSVVIVVYAFVGYQDPSTLQGRLLPATFQEKQQWVILRPEDVEEGVTLPARTHVLLHIPATIERITRRALFGDTGHTARYWGYCFPDGPLPASLRQGDLPGTVFLSEKERTYRAQSEIDRTRQFTVQRSVQHGSATASPLIRHQQEIFRPGETCYVMSELPLPVGIDGDGDYVNIKLELDYKTDPLNPDTDGDGLPDGTEVFRLKTNPRFRDSDSDNIPDGVEDANRNGRVEYTETSPLLWDTDHDGLCDGYCVVKEGGSRTFSAPKDFSYSNLQEIRGEDKNLNGVVDKGETDPRTDDTDGDGVTDEEEYFRCKAQGGKNC